MRALQVSRPPVRMLGDLGIELEDTWHHKHPWLGLTVAFFGPVVLGLGIAALLDQTPKYRRAR